MNMGAYDALQLFGQQWDSAYYVEIAENGYEEPTFLGVTDGIPQKAAFFPLFPLAGRWLSDLTGLEIPFALIMITFVTFLGGLLVWRQLIAEHFSAGIAFWAVVLMCLYPYSIFYECAYTEGPLLLLSGLCFWFYDRKKLTAAFVLAGVATAIRPTAIGISAAMLIDQLLLERRPRARWALLAFFGFSGILVFFSFHWARFGDFFTYSFLQKRGFGTSVSLDFVATIKAFLGSITTLHGLLGMVAVFLLARRTQLPRVWHVYGVVVLLLILKGMSSHQFYSTGRHLLPLMPLFVAAALVLQKRPVTFAFVLLIELFWLDTLLGNFYSKRFLA